MSVFNVTDISGLGQSMLLRHVLILLTFIRPSDATHMWERLFLQTARLRLLIFLSRVDILYSNK